MDTQTGQLLIDNMDKIVEGLCILEKTELPTDQLTPKFKGHRVGKTVRLGELLFDVSFIPSKYLCELFKIYEEVMQGSDEDRRRLKNAKKAKLLSEKNDALLPSLNSTMRIPAENSIVIDESGKYIESDNEDIFFKFKDIKAVKLGDEVFHKVSLDAVTYNSNPHWIVFNQVEESDIIQDIEI